LPLPVNSKTDILRNRYQSLQTEIIRGLPHVFTSKSDSPNSYDNQTMAMRLDLMHDQSEIHRKCRSKEIEDREEAARALGKNFNLMPDKEMALIDILRLNADDYEPICFEAAESFEVGLGQIPNKDQLWKDILKLIYHEDQLVQEGGLYALASVFMHVSDKGDAWQDILKLAQIENLSLLLTGVPELLLIAIDHVPDADRVWKDLLGLIKSTYSPVRWIAAMKLGSLFGRVRDQMQAWLVIHELTHSKDTSVRQGIAETIGLAFEQIPDKDLAWLDLHRLIQDEDSEVRKAAVRSLGNAFRFIPDKEEAWKDIRKLTHDGDLNVRVEAIDPKETTSDGVLNDMVVDLHEDSDRCGAAEAIGLAFRYIPDKTQAGMELLRLIQCREGLARSYAADSLGLAFTYVADKEQVCRDILLLVRDRKVDVIIMIRILKKFCNIIPEENKRLLSEAIGNIELAKETPEKFEIIELAFAYLLLVFQSEKGRDLKSLSVTRKTLEPTVKSSLCPNLPNDEMVEVWAEISEKRNNLEKHLRDLVNKTLKIKHGKNCMEVLLKSIPKERRASLMIAGYDGTFQKLYFIDLMSIITQNWEDFKNWFNTDLEDFKFLLKNINKYRIDAHAKDISDSELKILRYGLEQLEKPFNNYYQ
jgi:HEAT repeat protein